MPLDLGRTLREPCRPAWDRVGEHPAVPLCSSGGDVVSDSIPPLSAPSVLPPSAVKATQALKQIGLHEYVIAISVTDIAFFPFRVPLTL